eukprot:12152067-Alexandrium_andersonii.AAC.1
MPKLPMYRFSPSLSSCCTDSLLSRVLVRAQTVPFSTSRKGATRREHNGILYGSWMPTRASRPVQQIIRSSG